MLLFELINWWYGRGFKSFVAKLVEKIRNTADFFSISSLLRTLFLPFRQISAGATGESLDARFQAMLDRLISRFVGFIIRITLIVVGLITLVLQTVTSLLAVLAYPFMPAMPICCVILWLTGVTL